MEYEDPSLWVYNKDEYYGKKDYSIERHESERKNQGFSEYDWWNFNNYIAWVNINALEKFKTGAGHPVTDECQSMEDWIAILDKMINGFKAYLDYEVTEDLTAKKWEDTKKTMDEGLGLYAQYFSALWD